MLDPKYLFWIEDVVAYATFALAVILAALVAVGLANGVFVVYRTLRSPGARHDVRGPMGGPLPEGFISAHAYIHLIADVLLVLIAVELLDTLHAFLASEDPRAYLLGVLSAAIVAIARRIIVFFNPEAQEASTKEIYAYGVLLGILALAYVLIRQYG